MLDVLFERLVGMDEDLAAGLAAGLFGGLVLGLVLSLAAGLLAGLVWGLLAGLVWGLAAGLFWGLVWGLEGLSGTCGALVGVGLIAVFSGVGLPFWIIALAVLALAELLFFLDPKKPSKNDDWFVFTAKRKAWNTLTASLIVLSLNGLFVGYELASEWFGENMEVFIQFIGFVSFGIELIILLGVAATIWVALNLLKYVYSTNEENKAPRTKTPRKRYKTKLAKRKYMREYMRKRYAKKKMEGVKNDSI